MFGTFRQMMPPSTATAAPAAAVGFQFNKSASVNLCRCLFFQYPVLTPSRHPPPLMLPPSPPLTTMPATTTLLPATNRHLPKQYVCRHSITLSHVVLQFVLQMARDGQRTSSKQGGEQRMCVGNAGSGHFSVDERRRPECRMD